MPNKGFGPAQFQKFAVRTSPGTVAGRLKVLRSRIAETGLDGFLIPRADAYRNEMVAFIDLLRNGTAPLAGIRDGLEAQRLAEAAQVSMQTGLAVQLHRDWSPAQS